MACVYAAQANAFLVGRMPNDYPARLSAISFNQRLRFDVAFLRPV
jgi:hypothetical protein